MNLINASSGAQKRCSACKADKLKAEFHKNSRARDGLFAWCKPCAIARATKWGATNPERRKKARRNWYLENIETEKATNKKWHQENHGHHLQRCKKWRAENVERHRSMKRQWRDANPERRREAFKAYAATTQGRAILLCVGARDRARKAGVPYSLDPKEIQRRLDVGKCEVTGVTFDLEGKAAVQSRCSPWVPSIDRIRPKDGYTPDNIRIVCWIYNLAKGEFEHDDVVKMAAGLIHVSGGRDADSSGI